MNYIGCDCHISTLDCAVVNERGQETKKQKMNTGVKGLMEFVKSIPKPRKIIIEEGTLASWLLEVCTAYGEELIITDPKTNRWIGRAGQKNDDYRCKQVGTAGQRWIHQRDPSSDWSPKKIQRTCYVISRYRQESDPD